MPIPDVGQVAPDFSVVDAEGRPFTLSACFGRGPVVLLFFRGHWCPFCRRQMSRLQASLPAVRQHGARVIALSVDEPPLSRRLAYELGLEFPILSDPESAVVDLYGVRNRLLGVKSGIPHPATFLIDSEGVIQFREVRHNYKRRVSPSRILRELDRLAGASARA